MKSQIEAFWQLLSALRARSLARFFSPQEISVFETSVGLKYRHGSFDSRRFEKYVIREAPMPMLDLGFKDLVLPPDLLRDRYTLCGHSINKSPHFSLMRDISNGQLTETSTYVQRLLNGTLDVRLPRRRLSLSRLHRKFQVRQAELARGEAFVIYAIGLRNNKSKEEFAIVDGKHRAAMIAYYDRPDLISIREVSNEFVNTEFFDYIYSNLLRLNPSEYSINQAMIRAIQSKNYE